MHVSHIMSQHVVSVGPDDSLAHARELLDRYQFRHLPVVEEGKLVGILSDRDVLRNLSPFVGKATERSMDTNLLKLRVHQIMTRKPVTARPESSIGEVGTLLLQRKISCVPIVDAIGACVGLVSTRDVLHWCLHSKCVSDDACAA